MSLCIIIQREANTAKGGSIDGVLSTSSSANAGAFYLRRLTDLVVNEQFSSGINTVQSFTPSTGVTTGPTTGGVFTLIPGSYRISISSVYSLAAAGDSVAMWLYNATTGQIATYADTAIPIIGTPVYSTAAASINLRSEILDAALTVSGVNQIFAIGQSASSTTTGRSLTFGGRPTTMTGGNVNGSAASNIYCTVKICKVS